MCSACEYSLSVIVKGTESQKLMVCAAGMIASCMTLASATVRANKKETEKPSDDQTEIDEMKARIAKCCESTSKAVHTWLATYLFKPIAKVHGEDEKALSDPEEPEVWSQLAGVTFGEEHIDADWRRSLTDKLNERIKQVRLVHQVDIFCEVDLDKLNSVIAECFTSAAFSAVERLCQSEKEGECFQNAIPSAAKYGSLFSYMLSRTWHRVEETSLLRHLLTWQPFLGFFKMYAGASLLKETLADDCKDKITVAVSELEDMKRKLLDGTIAVKELKILIEFSFRFLELSKIITPENPNSDKYESQKAEQLKLPPSNPTRKEIVDIALERRRDELNAFKEERRQLQKFLGMSEIISPIDRSMLQQKVNANVDNLPVNQLCAAVTFDNKQAAATSVDLKEAPEVIFFNLAPHVKAILDPVGRLDKSILFHAIWKEKADEARSMIRKSTDAASDEMPYLPDTTEDHQIVLTIDQVVTDVCQPALFVWEKQREDIETGEITLEDVDKYFGGIMDKEQDLHQEIATLSNNPKACWVTERTDQIMQYHLLGQYTKKAKHINDVKETYDLQGDFSSVQTLLESKDPAFKKRTLRSIDDSVFKSTSTLAELTEATSEALSTFVVSKPLVDWMRKHTKDTKQLKVFADLASISAGETDIEIDRVNMLLSAGIGFGPLIYDLKRDAGFAEVMQAAKKLQTYQALDPNIRKKLRAMKNHLSWLEHVQESHGSVEKSSLSQAEAINARGIYVIGNIGQPDNLHEPLDSVVTMLFSQAEGDTDCRQYSVSSLKTLQSKLMLIAGTARKGKEEVERFVEVFEGVMRLGNMYLQLRKAGSVLFDKWTCNLYCNPQNKRKAVVDFGFESPTLDGTEEDIAKEVTNLANLMESCLGEWRRFVDSNRGKYPELNNFTTEQVVVLRGELAKHLHNKVASSQAIVLLDSVKKLCSVEDLRSALLMVKRDEEDTVEKVEGSSEWKVLEARPISEAIDPDALLKQLHSVVSDLSEDMAKAALKVALKVSQKGNFDETLDEAIDWCNFGNEELAQEVLAQNEDTTDLKEQHSKEAIDVKHAEEQNDPNINTPKLAPLNKMASLGEITHRLVTEANERDATLVEKISDIWDLYLKSNQLENMTEYLSLGHLGLILQKLSPTEHTSQRRPWPDTYLKEGVPNLIVCPAGDMLRTVLSLYSYGGDGSPMPSYSEVLLCTSETTVEEIVLLWRRAITDNAGRIFCLVNIDKLDHDVSVKAEEERLKLMRRQTGCHLVLMCAREKQHESYIAAALEQYRVQQFAPCPHKDIRDYLSKQLVESNTVNGTEPASRLDYQRSSVRVISSNRPGLGKSLYVQRRAEQLQANTRSVGSTSCYLKIPFHEAVIDVDSILSALNGREQHAKEPSPTIIHLDMSPLVRKGMDDFLFNLMVLGRVMGKDGKVWLRLPWDLYLIERTLETPVVQNPETTGTQPFVSFLPSATCRSPTEILEQIEQRPTEEQGAQDPTMDATTFPTDPTMDATIFSTDEFQRPFHYLRHWEAGEDLDRFTFDPHAHSAVDNHASFLKVVLCHCGIKDPSWAELRHFLSFLNYQLRDYEQSDFCKDFLRDSLPGLRKFVVDFMIIMSKDFATHSLEMADESPSFKVDFEEEASYTAETDENPIQYHLRRRWENCPHPYLFFNSDHHTMTFLGFHVDTKGNIRDPTNNSVLQQNVMGKPLQRGLVLQGVDLQLNFDELPR
ncbi:RNF213 [Branchiostoma lanceolatum]|uniref:RNF213 protein n=1 Tax=Branchiostoma lanceolatum TaxID=7740 RepID=A0A8J9YPW8_BRALA|nr:RNF213 [Branchiostoma lanceolatum]